jgi:hypothetical protein
MYKFSDAERAFLTEMWAITKDDQGREFLVGLTIEETSIYMTLAHKYLSKHLNDEESQIYLKLHDKHEHARLEVIGTEAYLRVENPIRH